ncbi:TPA: restriction endonuclease [Vibrio parahaemolyticus]|nr:restriction endonuclease [Vibrio parahaemolyticus]HCG8159284.1 restriction endonuclease [Vibrio parahaemolyticus]HCG9701921.1 restriction endonuclease [Vibrio parahaemolyticus]
MIKVGIVRNIFYMADYDCVVNVDAQSYNKVEKIHADFRYVDPEFPSQYGDTFEPDELMESLVKSKSGIIAPVIGKHGGILQVKDSVIEFNNKDNGIGGVHPLGRKFDHFFLDTFSVIENGEKKKREIADFELGLVERTVLDILKTEPTLVNNFSPRGFEVAIAIILKELGFDTVTLKRFSKDDGIDIFAVYVEGNTRNTVVVEVKKYKSNVGIEVVDRIFGVKAREDAKKALVVTSSTVTRDVKRLYKAKTDQIACLDLDRLTGFLGDKSSNWIKTPSDLWLTKNAI